MEEFSKRTIQQASEFTKAHKGQVNRQYKPEYHLSAPTGWINDPNGFSYFQGEYHLFYQHYPYSTTPGPMHWGHAKSKDLVTWTHLPVALVPNTFLDHLGCFSGTGFEHEGQHWLFYTGVSKGEGGIPNQRQCVAIGDGVTYNKHMEFLFTEETLPADMHRPDFRDPSVFKHGDNFYCILGTRTMDGRGTIPLYQSTDLYHWEYKNNLLQSKEHNMGVYECPDYLAMDGKDILLFSPQNKRPEGNRYHNLFASVYTVGNIDYQSGSFHGGALEELDFGFDFYAPQTMTDPDGRKLLVAWMSMWERTLPPKTENHGWVGNMTIPRELTLVDGRIYQQPISELKAYRKNPVTFFGTLQGELLLKDFAGTTSDIELTFHYPDHANFGIKVFANREEETVFFFSPDSGEVTLDRSKSGIPTPGSPLEVSSSGRRTAPLTLKDNTVNARILLDKSTVEAFLNDGERTMSTVVYPAKESCQIFLFSDAPVTVEITKYDI